MVHTNAGSLHYCNVPLFGHYIKNDNLFTVCIGSALNAAFQKFKHIHCLCHIHVILYFFFYIMNSSLLVQFLNVIIDEYVSSEISHFRLGWQISQQNWKI